MTPLWSPRRFFHNENKENLSMKSGRNDGVFERFEEEILSNETALQFLSEKRDLLALQIDVERSKQRHQSKRLRTLVERKERLKREADEQEQQIQELSQSVEACQERLEQLTHTPHFTDSRYRNGEAVEATRKTADVGERDELQSQIKEETPAEKALINRRVGAHATPVTSIHSLKCALDNFWSRGNSRNGSFVFLPCLDSLEVIRRAMDMNALETMVLDRVKPECSQHRAESLKNTCLDIFASVAPNVAVRPNETKDDGERVRCEGAGPRCLGPSRQVDPDVALCPYELAGVCADISCPYQHLEQRSGVSKTLVIARERVPLPPLRIATADNEKLKSVNTDKKVSNTSMTSVFQGGIITREVSSQKENETAKTSDSAWGKDEDFVSLPLPTEEEDEGRDPSMFGRYSDEDSDDSISSHLRASSYDPSALWWTTDEDVKGDCEWDRGNVDGSRSLIEWLHRYGGFRVLRKDSKQQEQLQHLSDGTVEPKAKRSRHESPPSFNEPLELHYEFSSPTRALDIIAFVARVVDCVRVLVHGGRFDLAHALQRLLQQQLAGLTSLALGAIPTDNEYPTMEAQLVRETLQLLSEQLEKTVMSSFNHNSEEQGIFYRAFDAQIAFAMLSEYVRLLYNSQMNTVEKIGHMSEWKALLEELSTMFFGAENERSRLSNANITKADRIQVLNEAVRLTNDELLGANSSILMPVSESSQEHSEIASFRSLLSHVRAGKSVLAAFRMQVETGSAWQRALASFLTCAKRSASNCDLPGDQCLLIKITTILGYVVIGIVHMVTSNLVDFGITVHENAIRSATLRELDSCIKEVTIFLSRENERESQKRMELSCLATAPIQGISASLAACVGLYGETQNRLERALSGIRRSQNTDFQADRVVAHFSELLWSQLVVLRQSLPSLPSYDSFLSSPTISTLPEEVSQVNMEIATQVVRFGLHLNHVTLHGDGNLVSAIDCEGDDTTISSSSDLLQTCHSIVLAIFGEKALDASNNRDAAKPSVVLNCKTSVNLQGIPLMGDVDNDLSTRDRSPFPTSILLAGNAIVSLCLKRCSLAELPETFGMYFENLQVLDVCDNRLSRLPSSIGLLVQLKHLMVSRNRIKALPPSIVDCINLEILDLRENMLETLPTPDLPLKLTKLKSLRTDRTEPNKLASTSSD